MRSGSASATAWRCSNSPTTRSSAPKDAPRSSGRASEHAPKAAAALKMTSRDLLRFGIIDDVIPEPLGGAHRDHREAAAELKSYLIHAIRQLKETPIDELLDRRYEKYRKIGVFLEGRPSIPEQNGRVEPLNGTL